jgi:hypothetical protein
MTAAQLIEALEAGHAIGWQRRKGLPVEWLWIELETTPSGDRVVRLGGFGSALSDPLTQIGAVIQRPEMWVIGDLSDDGFRPEQSHG